MWWNDYEYRILLFLLLLCLYFSWGKVQFVFGYSLAKDEFEPPTLNMVVNFRFSIFTYSGQTSLVSLFNGFSFFGFKMKILDPSNHGS